MELRLNPCYSGRWSRRALLRLSTKSLRQSLNPCCSGRWSRRALNVGLSVAVLCVLILVIAVDGLGDGAQVMWTRYRQS